MDHIIIRTVILMAGQVITKQSFQHLIVKQYKAGLKFGDFKDLKEMADYHIVDTVDYDDAVKALNLAKDIFNLLN